MVRLLLALVLALSSPAFAKLSGIPAPDPQELVYPSSPCPRC